MYFMFILILVCFMAILIYTYVQCFHSPVNRSLDPSDTMEGDQYFAVMDNILTTTRIMQETPCEEITISSFDGLQLFGRYYHLHDGAPIKILFHGYRSHALRDCSGGFILARKLGFNVLAVDQRAHAHSQGRVISFGVLERQDCLSWVNYIHNRFGKNVPIILSGLSMGASTVIMASDLPLPENVACVLADSPYSSPIKIIYKVCKDRNLPAKLAYPFICLGAKLFGGFSIKESDPIRSVKNTNLPILLIHGLDDRFVPWQMSEEIYDTNRSLCQLHLFPEAGHGLSYMIDPLRYEAVIINFLWNIPILCPYLENNEYARKMYNGESPIDL